MGLPKTNSERTEMSDEYVSQLKDEAEARAKRRKAAKKAAMKLAAILYSELDAEVDPQGLARVIKARWAKIAPLAHIVHDAPDDTKQVGP